MFYWLLTLILGLIAALFTTTNNAGGEGKPDEKPNTPGADQDDADDDGKKPDPKKDEGLPDYVKELRDEAARNRAAMKDFQTLLGQMTGTLQQLVKGEKPANDPKPDLKTKEGNEVFSQIEQTMTAINQRLTEAEQAVKKSETKALKESIGRKYGLDAELVAKLEGGTQEELEADAKKLAQFKKGVTPPLGNSGADDSDVDLSWHPLKRNRSSAIGRGGVRKYE
jgi:uncharacterized phage infection (PIP) family protein YhgE